MKDSATAGTGALQRLRDEQQQIEESLRSLGDTPPQPMEDRLRIQGLVLSLLRVHDALESTVLQPALQAHVESPHPVVQRSASRRAAVRDAADRLEALPPQDARWSEAVATLGERTRDWFAHDDGSLFELVRVLARDRGLDLAALDDALATRQESLLSAGGDGSP